MKKIYILLALIAAIVLALPFIGNSVAKEKIQTQIEILQSNGVTFKSDFEVSTFFTTTNHYEFFVSDTEKFFLYLSTFSDEQIPPYVDALIDGVTIGCDIGYSNLPLSNTLEIDIYPLSLSHKLDKELKEYSFDLHEKINTLLGSKGVLYHINYNYMTQGFDGYIKDMKESFELQEKSILLIDLSGITFNGSGELVAPTELRTYGKKISFKMDDTKLALDLLLEDFESSSTFESASTYISTASLGSLHFGTKQRPQDLMDLDLKGLNFSISSNTQGEKAQVFLKSAFDSFHLKNDAIKLLLNTLNYDISLAELEKDTFEELRVLLSKTNTTHSYFLEQQTQELITRLLANGLKISIADLSLQSIAFDDAQEMQAFALQSELSLAKNTHLTNINQTKEIIENTTITTTFKLSKELFSFITKQAPMSAMAKGYAKEQGDDLVFDILWRDKKLTINDKEI